MGNSFAGDVRRPRIVAAISIGLWLFLPACTTVTELVPVDAEEAVIQRLDPDCAWRMTEDGKVRGFVVRFADSATPGRCSYSVRNALHQELGTIDELGRAWRFVPHQREAQWVCTATLSRGAARLLGAGERAKLETVELEELAAATPPGS